MDKRKWKMFSTAALVAFLVACGGGGGAKALADVTDAMFNALVARVTANESAIATLQDAPEPTNVVDANGTVVGPILSRDNGGMAVVEIQINGLPYVTSFGPDGTWKPKVTYHTEPTCSLGNAYYVDQREIEVGFDFVFNQGNFVNSQGNWFSLRDVGAAIIPGWRLDGTGFCEGIQNPRLKLYSSDLIGATDIVLAPFSVE